MRGSVWYTGKTSTFYANKLKSLVCAVILWLYEEKSVWTWIKYESIIIYRMDSTFSQSGFFLGSNSPDVDSGDRIIIF